MILRIDDTDVERNTEQSEQSIFEGLKWLELGWDEEYRQSERLGLHQQPWPSDPREGAGLSRLHAGRGRRREVARREHVAVQSRYARMSREESDRRAAAGRAVRHPLPRAARDRSATSGSAIAVYGEQSKSTADIEDFALLRSNGLPTYHMASCADDIDLRISQIIRGQDHLTNTFKHVLIFEAAGRADPRVRAPAAADRPRRREALQAQARSRRERDHLPRCRVPAHGVRQLPLPARAGRPRTTASR